jgi:hypothetical protein
VSKLSTTWNVQLLIGGRWRGIVRMSVLLSFVMLSLWLWLNIQSTQAGEENSSA